MKMTTRSDEAKVGRIYSQRIHGEMKWVWCLQTDPAPPPNTGTADALDDGQVGLQEALRGG
jgi:hypothetical protein